MKNILQIAALSLCICGCTTSQQTTAYKTIGATEAAVLNANAAYLDSVVTGQTPTNSVPTVESAFNDMQFALHQAAAFASGGTNSPTSPALDAKANAFINMASFRK
jgi:hypothetical protein